MTPQKTNKQNKTQDKTKQNKTLWDVSYLRNKAKQNSLGCSHLRNKAKQTLWDVSYLRNKAKQNSLGCFVPEKQSKTKLSGMFRTSETKQNKTLWDVSYLNCSSMKKFFVIISKP